MLSYNVEIGEGGLVFGCMVYFISYSVRTNSVPSICKLYYELGNFKSK